MADLKMFIQFRFLSQRGDNDNQEVQSHKIVRFGDRSPQARYGCLSLYPTTGLVARLGWHEEGISLAQNSKTDIILDMLMWISALSFLFSVSAFAEPLGDSIKKFPSDSPAVQYYTNVTNILHAQDIEALRSAYSTSRRAEVDDAVHQHMPEKTILAFSKVAYALASWYEVIDQAQSIDEAIVQLSNRKHADLSGKNKNLDAKFDVFYQRMKKEGGVWKIDRDVKHIGDPNQKEPSALDVLKESAVALANPKPPEVSTPAPVAGTSGWVESAGTKVLFWDSFAVWRPKERKLTIFYFEYKLPSAVVAQVSSDIHLNSDPENTLHLNIQKNIARDYLDRYPHEAKLELKFSSDDAALASLELLYAGFFGFRPGNTTININLQGASLIQRALTKFEFKNSSLTLAYLLRTGDSQPPPKNMAAYLGGVNQIITAK